MFKKIINFFKKKQPKKIVETRLLYNRDDIPLGWQRRIYQYSTSNLTPEEEVEISYNKLLYLREHKEELLTCDIPLKTIENMIIQQLDILRKNKDIVEQKQKQRRLKRESGSRWKYEK